MDRRTWALAAGCSVFIYAGIFATDSVGPLPVLGFFAVIALVSSYLLGRWRGLSDASLYRSTVIASAAALAVVALLGFEIAIAVAWVGMFLGAVFFTYLSAPVLAALLTALVFWIEWTIVGRSVAGLREKHTEQALQPDASASVHDVVG